MTPTAASCLRTAATVLSTLIIVFPAIWGGFALWYRIPGGRIFKGLCVVLWGAFSFAMLVVLWQGRITLGVIAFTAALVGLLLWWTRLQPTNDHEWADDVARITTGTRDGKRVTLHNVRNFDWRTETDYTQRWETRSYDLDHLRTVDMIMSYWGGPAIAHMLISFGFADGAQVVFSVEVRRQKAQAFSEIGGFFNDFELSIIAADE